MLQNGSSFVSAYYLERHYYPLKQSLYKLEDMQSVTTTSPMNVLKIAMIALQVHVSSPLGVMIISSTTRVIAWKVLVEETAASSVHLALMAIIAMKTSVGTLVPQTLVFHPIH